MVFNSIRLLAATGALALGLSFSAGAQSVTPADTIQACGGKGGCGCGKKKDGEKSCDKCGTKDCACGKTTAPDKSDADVIDLKNDKCPIMGGKAQKDVYADYQGVRVHFCCPGCDKTFLEDPAKYLAKLGITDLDDYKRKHTKK